MVTAAGTTCMVAAMLGAGGGGGFLHLQLPFLEIRRAIWASQHIFGVYLLNLTVIFRNLDN